MINRMDEITALTTSSSLSHVTPEEKQYLQLLALAQLGGVLSAEEMAQLTALLQKPQSAASAERALGDYVRVIREEAEKRGAGPGMDPLAAACEKYKQKKGYGGKQI